MDQAVSILRWTGGAQPQPWGKLARDPELWDHEGDALIYFGRRYPEASFRIPSSIIKKSGSEVLLRLLDPNASNGEHIGSPGAAAATRSPRSLRDNSSEGSSDYSSRPDFDIRSGIRKGGSGKSVSNFSIPTTRDDPTVRYQVYMPPPPGLSKASAIRYHLTTRNIFALLLNKCPVGTDFYQTLKDLQTRLTQYMPPNTNCAKLVVRYIVSKQLHNVSNNPAMAAGLLAWCEEPTVRWKEGWREAFVHCCGMFPRLSSHPEINHMSAVSLELLGNAHTELLARIKAAEDRLLTFKFEEIWPSHTQHHPARAGFSSLRKFLRHYHEKAYKAWKLRVAQEHCNDSWLTRELVKELQNDHGALYDFLVDREVVWEASGKVKSTNRSAIGRPEADDGLIMTLLSAFDIRHGYTSILHPYPVLPPSVPVENADSGDQNSQRKALGLFSSRSTRAREKRVLQAYADANNGRLLPKPTLKNSLIEAFRKYEKADLIAEIDPRDARKGRWMLLYCTLQVLAGISVDAPHLFFKDVPYFLNPRLTNTPPWAVGKKQPLGGKTVVGVFDEASRLYSHCWIVPKTWCGAAPAAIDDASHTSSEDDMDKNMSVEGRPSDVSTVAKTKAASDRIVVTTVEAVPDHGGWPDVAAAHDPLQQYDDEEADLENVGDPGFRAPLKRAKSQDVKGPVDSREEHRPAMPGVRLVEEDSVVGKSNYAAPAEW